MAHTEDCEMVTKYLLTGGPETCNCGLVYTDSAGGLWHIENDTPPVPTRAWDWQGTHDDYDGAPDSGDNRALVAPTREALIEEIEEFVEDEKYS